MEIIWLTENYPPNRGGMAQSCDRIVRNLRKNGFIIHVIHFFGSDYYPVKREEFSGSTTSFPVFDSTALTLHHLTHFLNQNFSKTDGLLAFGGYLPCLGLIPLASWRNENAFVAFRGNDFDQSIFSFHRQSSLFDLIQKANKIFTVTQEKKDKIESFLTDQQTNKVFFTPNGIDLKDWQPNSFDIEQAEQLKSEKKKIRIGFIGQLKDKKGVKFWIDAMERSGMREKIEMLWVGEIEEDIKNIIPVTDFQYPFLDRLELLPYYLSCDFIAIPSFYDGMPNVLLESMALGKPCIAANTGGMTDVIQHMKNGYLFKPADINDAAQCIFTAIEQHQQGILLGLESKKTIENDFTAEMESKIWMNALLSV